MTITERLFQEMEKKGVKQKKIAEKLGIRQGVVANWKMRGTTPPLEYALELAKILDTSIEYLITGEEPIREYYSEDERSLITTYRKTDQPGRLRILEYAKDMAQLHPDQGQDQESLSISKIS